MTVFGSELSVSLFCCLRVLLWVGQFSGCGVTHVTTILDPRASHIFVLAGEALWRVISAALLYHACASGLGGLPSSAGSSRAQTNAEVTTKCLLILSDVAMNCECPNTIWCVSSAIAASEHPSPQFSLASSLPLSLFLSFSLSLFPSFTLTLHSPRMQLPWRE